MRHKPEAPAKGATSPPSLAPQACVHSGRPEYDPFSFSSSSPINQIASANLIAGAVPTSRSEDRSSPTARAQIGPFDLFSRVFRVAGFVTRFQDFNARTDLRPLAGDLQAGGSGVGFAQHAVAHADRSLRH